MKAELQFFAMPDDIDEILALVNDKIDFIEDNHHWLIADCEVTYKAGVIKGNVLLMGSIAINTGSVDNSCVAQERAKAVYRTVRKWMKKHYSNQLNTYQLVGERKDKAARNHWISPAAAQWKTENPANVLKIIEKGAMAFEIMQVSRLMGEVVPVSSNKVRGHG
jgi:hypothetical protein